MTSDRHLTSPAALGRPISHIGYAVEDIPSAIDYWVTMYGAGPFFYLPRVVFDEVIYLGEPAEWDHGSAFGQWGPIAIEFQQLYRTEPESIARELAPSGMTVNHVSYFVTTPEAESARLEALGFPKFLVARVGDVEITWHDVPPLGHAIEIHKESKYMRRLLDIVASAAEGWDGEDRVREMPVP